MTQEAQEARDKAAALLRLLDARYFSCAEDCSAELQQKLNGLFSGGSDDLPPDQPPPPPVSTMAIGAPRRIALEDHQDIPLLLAMRNTGQRQWEVDYQQNLKVAAVDLDSGALYLDRPSTSRRPRRLRARPPSMSGPPPDEINARSTHTGVQRYLLHDLGFPRRPSRLALTAFVYDWVSNTVPVELEGASSSSPSTASRAPSASLGQAPAGSTPALPPGGGAALCVLPRVSHSGPIAIGGRVDLPLQQAIVSRSPAGDPLVTISLLLLKKDDVFPPYLTITAPAELIQAGSERRVRASFYLDLREALPQTALAGIYQIYAIAGMVTVGPYAMIIEH